MESKDKTTRTLYRISNYSWGNPKIETVESHKQSDHYVWFRKPGSSREYREAWNSNYGSYHETWEKAQQKMIEIVERDISSLQRQLDEKKGFLGNVKGMKKP